MTRAAQLRTLARAALPIAATRALEARRLFRERGLADVSLRSAFQAWLARVHLLPADLDLRHATVVDIGANEGAFSAGLLAIAPEAHVIAVEPGPAPLERLRARLGGYPNVEIRAAAVARESGTAAFHLTGHDHGSSLRRPLSESRAVIGAGAEVVETIEVPTLSLDDLVGDRTVDVLKIDVQGSELDVLRGGREALGRTRAVLLEMNFFSQYEGDATFDTLHSEMSGLGFELINVSPPLTKPDGTAIFIDGCYARG
jgi:FkbM family methyltransferase